MNIVYHQNNYYLFEPKNKDENEENIIDNHLWLIMKFMPKRRHPVSIGDVIRFGRIPFKVVRCVLDVEKERIKLRSQRTKQEQLVSASMAEFNPDDGPL